ncbi:MAG: hypothetical protein IKK15_06435 [Akkermansia sp.]|nr:hypothetical protein [Akkermansia sp.]
MAPGQRAENKKMLGIYIDEKLLERFKAACEFFGFSMTTLLETYITEKANEYEKLLRSGRASRKLSKKD